MKQGKSGIMLLFIIAAVILLAVVMSGLLTIVSPFSFAGLTFTESNKVIEHSSSSGSADVSREGEYLVLKSQHNGIDYAYASISADITQIDELLVIADASIYASAGARSGAGGWLEINLKGSQGGLMEIVPFSVGASGETKSQYFTPKVVKVKNNFDGTWSFLESLNVGDIYVVTKKGVLQGNVNMELKAHSSGSGENGGASNVQVKIYNIPIKENAFAVCKADQFMQDKNQDGRISTDGTECFDLSTIVLNNEEALQESYDEKLARITMELQAKNDGLAADINLLRQQLTQQQGDATILNKIALLEAELKETKAILANAQANDKSIVAVVEAQEQFNKPNFIKEFFNKIIAWIMGIFI